MDYGLVNRGTVRAMHLDGGFALRLPGDTQLYRSWPADVVGDADTRLATPDDYEQAGCEWARYKGTSYTGPRTTHRFQAQGGVGLDNPVGPTAVPENGVN